MAVLLLVCVAVTGWEVVAGDLVCGVEVARLVAFVDGNFNLCCNGCVQVHGSWAQSLRRNFCLLNWPFAFNGH